MNNLTLTVVQSDSAEKSSATWCYEAPTDVLPQLQDVKKWLRYHRDKRGQNITFKRIEDGEVIDEHSFGLKATVLHHIDIVVLETLKQIRPQIPEIIRENKNKIKEAAEAIKFIKKIKTVTVRDAETNIANINLQEALSKRLSSINKFLINSLRTIYVTSLSEKSTLVKKKYSALEELCPPVSKSFGKVELSFSVWLCLDNFGIESVLMLAGGVSSNNFSTITPTPTFRPLNHFPGSNRDEKIKEILEVFRTVVSKMRNNENILSFFPSKKLNGKSVTLDDKEKLFKFLLLAVNCSRKEKIIVQQFFEGNSSMINEYLLDNGVL